MGGRSGVMGGPRDTEHCWCILWERRSRPCFYRGGSLLKLAGALVGRGKRLCDKNEGCVLTFYECLFSQKCFQLSFNDFEVDVLNHLGLVPLQPY